MKHRKKPMRTIFSKYHANTPKVCFPIKRFVTMFSIYEMTNFDVIWVKVMILHCKRHALTSHFDVSKTAKTNSKCDTNSFGSVCQLLSVIVNCMRDSKPQVQFNSINHLKCHEMQQNQKPHEWSIKTNLWQQSLQNVM